MLIYDSTNPYDIPLTADVVAGYVDGIYAWPQAGWDRFAGTPKIRIAVFGQTNDGDALDVERGDATPSEAPVWVQMRRGAGVRQPWLYVNRSNRGAVESALIAAGILSDQAALWVATLDGTQSVPAGPYPIAAVQYANSIISGGHYDLSIVTAYGASSGVVGGNMLDINTKRAFVRLAYLAALGREPESPAVMDGWANSIADDGSNLDSQLSSLADSPEGQSHRAAVAKAIEAPTPAPQPDDDSAFLTKAALKAAITSL